MKRTRIVDRRRMEGHDIKRGQVLFVAETGVGTDFYDAKVSGVLSKILVQRGEYVDMQSVVGIITSDGDVLV
jgi:pyruvate/2-oxoglutarate dehydrogenase complex dihydrolipoamide acyltransferase (E2) component